MGSGKGQAKRVSVNANSLPTMVDDPIDYQFSALDPIYILKHITEKNTREGIERKSVINYYIPDLNRDVNIAEEDYILTEMLRDFIGDQKLLTEIDRDQKKNSALNQPSPILKAVENPYDYKIKMFKQEPTVKSGMLLRTYVLLNKDDDVVKEFFVQVKMNENLINKNAKMGGYSNRSPIFPLQIVHPIHLIIEILTGNRV